MLVKLIEYPERQETYRHISINVQIMKQANLLVSSKGRPHINQSGNNHKPVEAAVVEAEVAIADVLAVTDAENTEEDDELGRNAMEMWLEALIDAESTSEPVVRTIAESGNDDDLY
jgi:hypothetical protein